CHALAKAPCIEHWRPCSAPSLIRLLTVGHIGALNRKSLIPVGSRPRRRSNTAAISATFVIASVRDRGRHGPLGMRENSARARAFSTAFPQAPGYESYCPTFRAQVRIRGRNSADAAPVSRLRFCADHFRLV